MRGFPSTNQVHSLMQTWSQEHLLGVATAPCQELGTEADPSHTTLHTLMHAESTAI